VSKGVFWKCVWIVVPPYQRARRAVVRLCDRRLGITTANEDVAHELGHWGDEDWRNTRGAIPYLGSGRLMRKLKPNRNDVLLDMGCGAGRAICIAAQYPFSRVVGIEIDEGLCALAASNARRLRRCAVRPEVVRADVTTYRVPDDVTVVFLYNPFRGAVLHAALTRVLESFDRAPRRLRIVYANPREHELIVSMQRFRPGNSMLLSWRPEPERRRTKVVQFYEVEPREHCHASSPSERDVAAGRELSRSRQGQ
jgi:predicted RNA methylase